VWTATPAFGESCRQQLSPRPNATAPLLDSTAAATRENDRDGFGDITSASSTFSIVAKILLRIHLRVCDLFDLRNKFRPILLDNFYEFRSKTE
jgi:hypothetical protein